MEPDPPSLHLAGMPDSSDPKLWRDRAAWSRAMAEHIGDEESGLILLDIARKFDELAERAAKLSVSSPVRRRR